MASHGASEKETKFGQDMGVIHEAVITGRKVGAGHEFWSSLAHNEELFKRVVKFEAANAKFHAMIKAGNCDIAGDAVTVELFLPEADDRVDLTKIQFIEFDSTLTTMEVMGRLDDKRMDPIKLSWLLAYGAQNKDDGMDSIVALGTLINEPYWKSAVHLDRKDAKRTYCQHRAGRNDRWSSRNHFAVIQK